MYSAYRGRLMGFWPRQEAVSVSEEVRDGVGKRYGEAARCARLGSRVLIPRLRRSRSYPGTSVVERPLVERTASGRADAVGVCTGLAGVGVP